jgi:hypothetical protein
MSIWRITGAQSLIFSKSFSSYSINQWRSNAIPNQKRTAANTPLATKTLRRTKATRALVTNPVPRKAAKQAFRHYAEEEEEEEDQYKQECGNSCGCVLTINTPIMCWNNGEKELTLCNECYWDAGYWKDDQNEDNQDEIEEFKSQ